MHCPHRIEHPKDGIMVCILIPGIEMPLPGRTHCPCNECETQWVNNEPPKAENPTAAILERLPRIPKAQAWQVEIDEFTGRVVNPKGDCKGCGG